MIKKTKLYDAFGELLYAIAIADGQIQEEEKNALDRLVKEHPWASEIKWSFDYENQKHHTVDEAYSKAIDICKENGPDPEYKYLLDVMVNIASSFEGIVPQEKMVLDNFIADLKNKFIEDLTKNKLADFDDE